MILESLLYNNNKDKMADIEEAHNAACNNGQDLFVHPVTKMSVMTSTYLSKRKTCCGKQCLFCPYKHANVKNHKCTLQSCKFQCDDSTLV